MLAGARDNANMFPMPEGLSPITNMYMWQPLAGAFYAPCVDGDYDMGVIGHEYGHLIENRMIGKGGLRSGHHAGAMGESHGDLMAMEYLNGNDLVPTGDENPYAVGTYATGNKVRAIRNYGMNFPMSGGVPEPSKQLMINALNFSDMGYDLTGPQVHADGEIWSKVNFDIRKALSAKYDGKFPPDDTDLQIACAEGELPPQNCPGNRRWMQLLFDAMLLMPTNPSMLQARDAQLAADLMRFGGANQKELWLEFARHGFGRNATSTNTTANTDTDPTPDFEADRDGSRDRDVHGAEAQPERAGQRADLRRALRGPLLADRRHRPGDDGPEPGQRRQVRTGDVRVRRHRTRVRPRSLPRADPRGQERDDHAAVRRQLGVRQRRSRGDRRHERCRCRRAGRPAPQPDRRHGEHDLDDRREHRRGGQPVRRRQEGHGRPGRDGGAEDQPRPGERPALEQRQPLHGAAPVRDLGV